MSAAAISARLQRRLHLLSLPPQEVAAEIKQIKQSLGLRGGEWTGILRQHAHQPTTHLLDYLRELQEKRGKRHTPPSTTQEQENATMAIQDLNLLTDLDGFGEEQFLPVKILLIDHSYQRPENLARIKRLAADFDSKLVGRLIVSHRDDGSYYVVSGQHRLGAMRIKQIKHAPCIVFEGWTREQEAKIYLEIDLKTRKLSRFEQHIAAVEAGEPDALAIQEIAARYGITVTDKTGQRMRGRLRCVSLAYGIVRSRYGGAEMLNRVISLLHDAYADEENAYKENMVSGLYIFLWRGMRDPNFDMGRLREVLQSTAISTLITKGRAIAEFDKNNVANGIAIYIHKVYNKGLRTRRLAEFTTWYSAKGNEIEE